MVAEVIAVNRTRRLETSLPQVLAAAFFAAALAAWIVPVSFNPRIVRTSATAENATVPFAVPPFSTSKPMRPPELH